MQEAARCKLLAGRHECITLSTCWRNCSRLCCSCELGDGNLSSAASGLQGSKDAWHELVISIKDASSLMAHTCVKQTA